MKPPPAQIWVVDDERNHRLALVDLLRTSMKTRALLNGGPIEPREFGKAGVAIAELRRLEQGAWPKLIIADVMMPQIGDGAFLIHNELKSPRYARSRPYLLWTSGKDSEAKAKAEEMIQEMYKLPHWGQWADYYEKPAVIQSRNGEPRLNSEIWIALVADLIRRQTQREYHELWSTTKLEAFTVPQNKRWAEFRGELLQLTPTSRIVVLVGPPGSPFDISAKFIGAHLGKPDESQEYVPLSSFTSGARAREELLGHGTFVGAFHRARGGVLLVDGLGNEQVDSFVVPNLMHLIERDSFPLSDGSRNLSFGGLLVVGLSDQTLLANEGLSESLVSQLLATAKAAGAPVIAVPGIEAFQGKLGKLATRLLHSLPENASRNYDTDLLEGIEKASWAGGLRELFGWVQQSARGNLPVISHAEWKRTLPDGGGFSGLPRSVNFTVKLRDQTVEVCDEAWRPIPGLKLSFQRRLLAHGLEPKAAFLYLVTMLQYKPRANAALRQDVAAEMEKLRSSNVAVFGPASRISDSGEYAGTSALALKNFLSSKNSPIKCATWMALVDAVEPRGVSPWKIAENPERVRIA